MAERGGAPCIGRMASATFGGCLKMGGWLAACLGAIVTAGAGADHIIVVDGLGRGPSGGRMAILASRVGRNMG